MYSVLFASRYKADDDDDDEFDKSDNSSIIRKSSSDIDCHEAGIITDKRQGNYECRPTPNYRPNV